MPTTTLPPPPAPQAVPTLQGMLDVAEERFRRRDFELRYIIAKSLLDSITQSRSWKLLAPLRALQNILRPRGFSAASLIPWNNLEQTEPGAWRSTGNDPQFVVPCYLPAGWVRVRLDITGEARGRSEIFVDTGDGFHSGDCLERFSWSEVLRDELFVKLSRPVRAIRFDP